MNRSITPICLEPFTLRVWLHLSTFLPHRNDYRKFRISSSVKDDLGAMREVLYRRYYHVMMEEEKGPDLIVLDGGETQVSVANEVLASLNLKIPVIGFKEKR